MCASALRTFPALMPDPGVEETRILIYEFLSRGDEATFWLRSKRNNSLPGAFISAILPIGRPNSSP